MQLHHGVADQVHRGLEPGAQHQKSSLTQLDVGQLICCIALKQAAENVVSGIGLQYPQVLVDPEVQRANGRLSMPELTPRQPWIKRERGGVAPLQQLVM